MGLTSKSPLRTVGAIVYSGSPNTGESRITRGGEIVYTCYSGGALNPGSGFFYPVAQNGDQVKLWSGAGRLNSVITFSPQFTLSGVAITFYDAGTPAASGPSTIKDALRVLGVVNGPAGLSGFQTSVAPLALDMPFTSGLCVAAISGTTGFSCSFTPEVNPPLSV